MWRLLVCVRRFHCGGKCVRNGGGKNFFSSVHGRRHVNFFVYVNQLRICLFLSLLTGKGSHCISFILGRPLTPILEVKILNSALCPSRCTICTRLNAVNNRQTLMNIQCSRKLLSKLMADLQGCCARREPSICTFSSRRRCPRASEVYTQICIECPPLPRR